MTNENEIPVSDIDRSEVETNPNYWDCSCKENYIHPKVEMKCYVCGALQEDMPDSRSNEVQEMLNGRVHTDVLSVFKRATASRRDYKIKELANELSYIDMASELFTKVYPYLTRLFDYCDVHQIEIDPAVGWADVTIHLPWQKELMELCQDIYDSIPEDQESEITAKEGLFFKTPLDEVASYAQFHFKFYTSRGWPSSSVILAISAQRAQSTCQLVKTKETKTVTATVYDIICAGEKTGEHLKLE